MCGCDRGFVCPTCRELEEQRSRDDERDWRDDEYDAAHRDTPEWSLEVGP